jgi:hypothetical protein
LTNEHGKYVDYFGTVTVEMLNPHQQFGSGNENPVHEITLYNA